MITYEISTEHVYPNLTIYNKLNNGVLAGYKVTANEGFVFYDTTANDVEMNEEGIEVPVTYYKTVALLPLNMNFNNFPYVAVPRDSVDENYIFGGSNSNTHETM